MHRNLCSQTPLDVSGFSQQSSQAHGLSDSRNGLETDRLGTGAHAGKGWTSFHLVDAEPSLLAVRGAWLARSFKIIRPIQQD